MTELELFHLITTDPKIHFYHDRLAMIDWTVSVCTKERKVTAVQGLYGKKQPRHVTLLKRYLKAEYGITNK